MLQAKAADPHLCASELQAPDPHLQSVNKQVRRLQEDARQLAQEKAALQRQVEAAGELETRMLELQREMGERDAALLLAEERIVEFQQRAREREAALQWQADAAEERVREVARQLDRGRHDAPSMDVRPVAHALTGGVCTASYGELADATRNFAAGSILGRGGFGPVYRGEWGGQAVAIKRLDQASPSL